MNDASQKNLTCHYRELNNIRYDFRNYNLIALITQKIQGDNVLDVGCGSGYLLDAITAAGKKATGIEPNKSLIALAKQRNPGLQIINGQAQNINKTLNVNPDCITMIDVLEHIENDTRQLQIIHDAIKNHGQIIVVVPAGKILYGIRDKNQGHWRRYSKSGLKRIIEKSGFEITELRHWNMLGFLPYLVAEKILQKELSITLRKYSPKSKIKNTFNTLLHFWFKHIENNIDFGFGLSLICVAKKLHNTGGK